MANEKDLLKETDLTWAGKLFFAGVASFLGSKTDSTPKIPIKIKATKEQVKAIMDVIQASKEFQETINQPDVPIETVVEKIKKKNDAKEAFKKVIGRDWPL